VSIPTLREIFEQRRAEGRAALIPYVTAGYPRDQDTVEVLRAVADAGADVLELGIPFSDPLADGPTIQRSSFEALEGGGSVASALSDLGRFRRVRDTPVVLFTYLNPVLRYGVDAFLEDALQAGAQGLLVTDLPAGADRPLEDRIRQTGIDLIRLVAPTTPPERVSVVADGSSGFLYYISRTGVTGARSALRESLGEEVRKLREAVALPVAVGFGISSPGQAADVAAVADGVVVGSALIQALGEGGVSAGASFVASLRKGMDGA
jgi:tryptophan synthase alpha chain